MAYPTDKSFRFERDAQAAVHAREAVRDVAGGAIDSVLSDVLLCVTELVTNSVTHAGSESGVPVEMDVRLDKSRLRVEVVDRGRAFDESHATPEDPLADAQRQRGWGLYIVSVLADRWGVEPGALTRVWFEKDVAGP
jgi:anti-sigma regulatory factor (Ser/Thr protein kinase)